MRAPAFPCAGWYCSSTSPKAGINKAIRCGGTCAQQTLTQECPLANRAVAAGRSCSLHQLSCKGLRRGTQRMQIEVTVSAPQNAEFKRKSRAGADRYAGAVVLFLEGLMGLRSQGNNAISLTGPTAAAAQLSVHQSGLVNVTVLTGPTEPLLQIISRWSNPNAAL